MTSEGAVRLKVMLGTVVMIPDCPLMVGLVELAVITCCTPEVIRVVRVVNACPFVSVVVFRGFSEPLLVEKAIWTPAVVTEFPSWSTIWATTATVFPAGTLMSETGHTRRKYPADTVTTSVSLSRWPAAKLVSWPVTV